LLQTVLTDRIEDWAISGAEHGIEYCYPLLDRALLEHILTLPPRMFVRKGERRWLVREVARGLVPELIRTNTSKNEVARGRQLEHALADAYREITRMLNEKPEPPAHAKYLDMEKVRKRLEKVDNTNSGRDKHLRRAIQLLDLT
jgi:asparagine synthase (glutamine-hydrolysing)